MANRVIAAAKAARPLSFVYSPLRGQLRLRLFVDASSVKTGVTTGHTGFDLCASPASVPAGRMPANATLVLLQYGSHSQGRVTHSSFAAEVYAMLEGLRSAKEKAFIHALVPYGEEYAQAPVDVYTDKLSYYSTLDADGVVQPKEVGAAVQELRAIYHDGTIGTVTWLRAHGQLADALTKPGRATPLQRTVLSGAYAVRLEDTDYLTKRSTAAPSQVGLVDNEELQEWDDDRDSTDSDDSGDHPEETASEYVGSGGETGGSGGTWTRKIQVFSHTSTVAVDATADAVPSLPSGAARPSSGAASAAERALVPLLAGASLRRVTVAKLASVPRLSGAGGLLELSPTDRLRILTHAHVVTCVL